MKSFSTFSESIIDIPRSTYAPMVFDKENTPNPVIKPSVIKMIDDQLAVFAKEHPVLKYTLIGSILTKRYRNDADLDINVLFDVPVEQQEDERLRLSKKYLSAKNPDNIQGINIPGTKHPVNYYFITDKETYDDQNTKADATFDIKGQKFIKRPDDFKFDISLYMNDFEKKVQEIDVTKGELKRDIVDYDELSELKPGEIKDLEKRVAGKLDEIEKNLQDLSNIGDTLDAERRDAFNTDMSPDQIKTFSIKNRLPKNVIYKMLEKYHYLTFLKKCKKILDDGVVTDAEIDTLRKEENGPRPVEEALDKTSKLVFAYGRFNPPTVGHAKLMKEVMTQARKNSANHIVYASASTDKQKNPLDQKTKIKFMKKMFPQNKILAAGGTQRTFMEVLKFYNKMYGEIIMVAGSDRIDEFQRIADNYNGKDYNYKSIKVVSSGERDPDAEGVMGMSASKMREMAKNNDFKTFKTGLTNLSDRESKKLFKAVKKGMGINESVDSFTDFINNDIREEFHQEKIFNVGDMVEHMDGTTGQIVRRGTNYVSFESDGLIKKAWLYDIQMSEEPRIPRKKGQPAGSDKHSDLYTDENPKGTIQGLGFKDVETARASVNKIKNSSKTHAHKIQAAVAMEQRAKEMGKSVEAKIYRTYIDKMKVKTKEMQKESLLDTLENELSEDSAMLRFRDLLPRKLKHALYRMSKGDKYKGALSMYHRLKKDTDVRKRGLSDAKIRGIAADSYSLGHREFDKVLDRKTRYEEPSVLEALENEMGSTDEFFELNQVGVKTVESYEIGTDEYRTHTQIMTPGQKIMSFKLANKVIERKDIELFANEDKIIDKYKKRYGDRWQDELEKAVNRMKKEL